MKKTSALLIFLLIVAAASTWFSYGQKSRPPKPPKVAIDPIEEEVLATEKQCEMAVLRADANAVDKLLTADYIQISARGDVRRKNHIVGGLSNGALRYETLQHSEFLIVSRPNTAIVTGIALRKGREGERDLSGRFRFTRTWVKEKGHWLLAAQHSSPIQE